MDHKLNKGESFNFTFFLHICNANFKLKVHIVLGITTETVFFPSENYKHGDITAFWLKAKNWNSPLGLQSLQMYVQQSVTNAISHNVPLM